MQHRRVVLIDGDAVSPSVATHLIRPGDMTCVATNNDASASKWQDHADINQLVSVFRVIRVPVNPQAADMALAFQAGRWAQGEMANHEWVILARDKGFRILGPLLQELGVPTVIQLDVALVASLPRHGTQACGSSKNKPPAGRAGGWALQAIRHYAQASGTPRGQLVHRPLVAKWLHKHRTQLPNGLRNALPAGRAADINKWLMRQPLQGKGDHVATPQ